MSKDDYARIFVHAPSRLVAAVVLAFGGGIGWQHFYHHGDDIETAQREMDRCLVALADSRSIAHQYERDVVSVSRWARDTIGALPEFRRVEALNSAPRAYSFAKEMDVSR